MKKLLLALLTLALLVSCVSVLGSCGGDKTPQKATWDVPEVGYDGSEVTITFYHTMSGDKLQPVLDLYIGEFNKLFPNIHVEHTQAGGYDEVRNTIKTQLTAGNQPNIAYCYPDHVALYNVAKAVVPLDNLINSTITVTHADGTTETLGYTDAQKADFYETYYNEGTVFDEAGTMYTLPLSRSTEALYYDKAFFEANGLSVPKTWDEMEAVCKRILEIDPTCIPLGYDSESNWFITMTEQLGSGYTSLDEDNHFEFDNAENRAFVKRFREWHQKGYMTTQEIYGSYTSGLFTNTEAGKPRAYMVIGSTGGASYQNPPKSTTDAGIEFQGNKYLFETGMALAPQVDPSKPKAISQGPSLCIFKDSNPQEVVASWLFVKFLTTSVEFQAEFSMTSGYAPVIKSAREHETYKNWLAQANGFNNLTAMSVNLTLANVDAYYISPAFVGSSEARDQVGKLMQDVFVSTESNIDAVIDEKFKKAVDECEYAAE